MLLSFIVYFSLGVTLFLLARHVAKREEVSIRTTGKRLPFYAWEIVVSIAIFALVAGLRYHTGFDHEMYLRQYQVYDRYGFFTRDLEPLFMVVIQLMNAAHMHYFFFFALWAAIQIGLVYFAFNNHKEILPWLSICVMSFMFLHWMNTMRQGVVEAMFIAMVPLIFRRRLLPFLVLVVIAAMLHKSALILGLFYFLPAFKSFSLRTRLLSALLVIGCSLLGTYPYWMQIFAPLAGKLGLIGYERYSVLLLEIFSGNFREVAWGPNRLVILLMVIVAICLAHKVCSSSCSNVHYPRYMTFALVGYSLGNILIRTNVFLLRPTEYLTAFIPIVAAFTLFYLYKSGPKWQFLGFLAIVCFPLFWEVGKCAFNPTETQLTNLYHLIPF